MDSIYTGPKATKTDYQAIDMRGGDISKVPRLSDCITPWVDVEKHERSKSFGW